MRRTFGSGIVKPLLIVVIVMLVGAGVVGAFNLPGLGKFEKVKAANGTVTIPLAKVSDGKARFFKYSQDGKDILFFVVKAPDGTYRTAFDACDVCYKEKKGYVQDGSSMVCKQCNRKFDTGRIGQGSVGGCNPSYLPHHEAGGSLVINVEDLKSGARFF